LAGWFAKVENAVTCVRVAINKCIPKKKKKRCHVIFNSTNKHGRFADIPQVGLV
jgi:hypothetical protein